jgi:hypothetical protein
MVVPGAPLMNGRRGPNVDQCDPGSGLNRVDCSDWRLRNDSGSRPKPDRFGLPVRPQSRRPCAYAVAPDHI